MNIFEANFLFILGYHRDSLKKNQSKYILIDSFEQEKKKNGKLRSANIFRNHFFPVMTNGINKLNKIEINNKLHAYRD